MRTKILLVFGTLLFAILLTEIGLWIAGVNPIKPESIIDGLVKWDDEIGWTSAPNFDAEYFDHRVRTNSIGFRDTEWERKSGRRILVLGDSFGWGWGVPNDSTFASVIEDSIGIEVMNMSVAGYSTDQQLLIYDRYGSDYDHDLVILQLYANDVWQNIIQDILLYMRKPTYYPVQIDSEIIMNYRPPVKLRWYESLHLWSIMRFRLVGLIWVATHQSFDFGQWLSPLERYNNSLHLRTLFLLQQLQKEAVQNGADLIIFSFAGTHDWYSMLGDYSDFINDCRDLGLLLIPLDCDELYQRDAMWIDDRHWSCKGNRIVAERMIEVLNYHEYH